MHGCIVCTVVTNAQVLKHQVISIHSIDLMFIVFVSVSYKNITLTVNNMRNYDYFLKEEPIC